MIRSMRRGVVRRARAGIMAGHWARYNRYHRIETAGYLATLRSEGRVLTPEQRRSCREYAHDVLGAGSYVPWLEVYTATRGEFRTGWIPDNYFGRWVVPRLAKSLSPVVDAKSLSRRLLRTDALPDVGCVVAGRLLDPDMQPLGRQALEESVGGGPDARVVFKADHTLGGMGVRVYRVAEVTPELVASLPDGVLQCWVVQHPDLAALYPDAVATVRLTTVKEPDGRFTLRAANLKVGLPGRDWVEWYYAVRIPVVGRSGELSAFGLDDRWRRLARHPVTGTAFAGRRVPAFEEAVRLGLRLHASVPHVGVVGWDVAIDETERVRLLEWNIGHPAITLNESVTGPCFTGLGWEHFHRDGQVYVPGPRQP